MGRIDRYILSQLVGAFGLFALILVSIYWLNRAISIFGRLIADGQGAGIFLQIIALSLPYVVSLVLPVALFAASVWVTNRLTAESERVVMEAAGASGLRLARPYLLFGLIGAVLVGALVHWLVPASRAELAAKRAEVTQDIAARLLVPGEFLHPADGVTLFIGAAAPSGALENLFLHEDRGGGDSQTYTAQQALIVQRDGGPVLLMFDGLLQAVEGPDRRLSSVSFADLVYDLAPFLANRADRQVPLREVGSLPLLRAGAPLQEATGAPPLDMRVEVLRRLSQTIAPVVYGLLGLAALIIGRFSRFGSWRQIVLATLCAVLVSAIGSRAEDTVGEAPWLWPLLFVQAALGFALIGLLLLTAARPGMIPRLTGRRTEP